MISIAEIAKPNFEGFLNFIYKINLIFIICMLFILSNAISYAFFNIIIVDNNNIFSIKNQKKKG